MKAKGAERSSPEEQRLLEYLAEGRKAHAAAQDFGWGWPRRRRRGLIGAIAVLGTGLLAAGLIVRSPLRSWASTACSSCSMPSATGGCPA